MSQPIPISLLDGTLRPDFQRGSQGLLPAIAQDIRNNRVLMMAWMDETAFNETLSTGMAVYYSRSRGKLWRKGEESGHRQIVHSIRVDCDADTILLFVEQTGAACHEGFESCFFREYRHGRLEVVDPLLIDPKSVYKSHH